MNYKEKSRTRARSKNVQDRRQHSLMNTIKTHADLAVSVLKEDYRKNITGNVSNAQTKKEHKALNTHIAKGMAKGVLKNKLEAKTKTTIVNKRKRRGN